MTPQRRTALVSVGAACVLIGLKLGAGIPAGSLGLVSEAVHSGTDLVAALLTFLAVGVAGRPADRGHPYGHGKAEHLAALAEAGILAALGLVVAGLAVRRLTAEHPEIETGWYVFAAIGAVVAVDASRALVSLRAGRRYASAALVANAFHFAGDLAGSVAVLVGLLAVRAGHAWADSAAAMFVAGLVLLAAGRLMRQNVDVLMDRAPAQAHAAARRAIQEISPAVDLRRLRVREAAGRHFADVVIGVQPGAAVAQGHAAADAVEAAVASVLPGADVVVHVEPRRGEEAALRERVLEAAQRVPRVREIHDVSVLRVGDGLEVSLHLKLPGDLTLEEAHGVASAVEAAIAGTLPQVRAVQTHLEPLSEPAEALDSAADDDGATERIRQAVRAATGQDAPTLRVLRADEGLVVFLTLRVDPEQPLAEAHGRASELEARIREVEPRVARVIVHTEP